MMVDQWAAETRRTTAITLPGEYNYLAPTTNCLHTAQYCTASPPPCGVKPRYEMFKILRAPPAAAAAARQPSML